jgi:hypothetical protein
MTNSGTEEPRDPVNTRHIIKQIVFLDLVPEEDQRSIRANDED